METTKIVTKRLMDMVGNKVAEDVKKRLNLYRTYEVTKEMSEQFCTIVVTSSCITSTAMSDVSEIVDDLKKKIYGVSYVADVAKKTIKDWNGNDVERYLPALKIIINLY